MKNALEKIKTGDFNLSDEEVLALLRIDTHSTEMYELMAVSNAWSRKQFGDRGYVFTQVGINAAPCSVNCRFCSMGGTHYSMDEQWEKSLEEVKAELKNIQREYFDDFFLMTTADYPKDRFMEIGREVRALLRPDQKLVANIGDFDLETGRQLKAAGFTGVYHINRLREGIDTEVSPETREKTLQAVQDAGLELYYCIEPIGPEHTYEEILTEIRRAQQLKIAVMAAMRRTAVKGTPMYDRGQITALELAKIVAVTNIVVQSTRSMNVHEPIQAVLWAGVNQLYAEAGANPRDTESHTEKGRGFTPAAAWAMLREFGWGY